MRTTTASLLGALALTGTSLAFTGTAQAAPATAQDATFLVANAHSNLAEIALGKLGEAKAQSSEVKELAAVTLKDHLALQARLKTVAKAAGVTLPASPNAAQQAVANQLAATSTSSFDLAYSKAEVMGHDLAIAAAKAETAKGSSATSKAYAAYYVPIAAMHLDMATSDVSALSTSAPTAVSAGTGGEAATSDSTGGWELGAGISLLAAAGAGLVLVRRQRATT